MIKVVATDEAVIRVVIDACDLFSLRQQAEKLIECTEGAEMKLDPIFPEILTAQLTEKGVAKAW